MSDRSLRGRVYRCPVCGAEITVLSGRMGDFAPRCCNTDMAPTDRRVAFYYCPVCGSAIAVLRQGSGEFLPRCCNTDMKIAA